MNELIVIFAVSVIIIGFLILVGAALWLAAERRRTLSALPRQPQWQIGSQPPAQHAPWAAQRPPVQEQPPAQQPAAPPTPAAAPAEVIDNASSAPPTGPRPHKEAHASGEYPSAALYDQTLLPEPPKRRTRPESK
ncbi:MAG TPA: hypothetical protein VH599_15785 [Ktedonobacterales bacterium]|jgi:hypothetical protein